MTQKDTFACPTSLHDQQDDESINNPAPVPASAIYTEATVFECRNCGHAQFVIIRGDVKCTSCDELTGMSVVATNIVQELRTANAEKNQGLAQLLELIIDLSEQFARAMPLAKPQIDTVIRVSRAKLLELKL